MSELMKRSVFGAIYVALMLWAVLSKGEIVFCLVFSFLAFAGIWEYSALVGLHRTRPLRTILDGLVAVAMVVSPHIGGEVGMLIPFGFYAAYIMVRSMYSERSEQPIGLAKNIFGHIYVTLPLTIMSWTHLTVSHIYGFNLLLLLLVCIWANDTGAYIVGSKFGRHRLFPSLSPKKSWEGFFGGMLFSVIASSVIMALEGIDELPMAILLGVIITIFATWGDLFESMLKRNAGVKDSGSLIPGHGGVLDRIDSLLFVGMWVLFLGFCYMAVVAMALFRGII